LGLNSTDINERLKEGIHARVVVGRQIRGQILPSGGIDSRTHHRDRDTVGVLSREGQRNALPVRKDG